MSDNKMLARIRALLAKAERSEFTEETETYQAKAFELAAQYGIDHALLMAAEAVRETVGDIRVKFDPPFALGKMRLLWSIARSFNCDGVYHRSSKTLHLFGHDADLEQVQLLYTSLLIQQATELTRTIVPAYENAKSFRASWLNGYAATIYSRLQAAFTQAKTTTGPGTDLVLADRKDRVSQRMRDAYPKTTKTGGPQNGSGTGYRAGQMAGERANLGGTSVTQQHGVARANLGR